jgi:small subunit ribosomal protein S9
MADSYYGTGRRKEAVARVWLTEGTGAITVNERPLAQYVSRPSLEAIVQAPFALTNTVGRFDVRATTKGGGISGQAGALRHGIARALVASDANYRTVLRRFGLLTRDARIKERKKYGRKRARRGFQFSKR